MNPPSSGASVARTGAPTRGTNNVDEGREIVTDVSDAFEPDSEIEFASPLRAQIHSSVVVEPSSGVDERVSASDPKASTVASNTVSSVVSVSPRSESHPSTSRAKVSVKSFRASARESLQLLF